MQRVIPTRTVHVQIEFGMFDDLHEDDHGLVEDHADERRENMVSPGGIDFRCFIHVQIRIVKYVCPSKVRCSAKCPEFQNF